ncbi:hypothetical protein G4Y79_04485 [Phototrophicus methaneseepsis]|uniref:Uncharacterized protein n=1 Tax=Phototrophicus methaneseepsis TaxID=2710758 RepID=A0A7S8EB70_9CHLR|nr:hypothetical protein [Phototrophicus methaneseepsis]QPC83644.1 hypothetical protein G4Y79_04485 [Phototrophicus methaneseepsis]
MSSKRASYHYIQVDADITIHHGYILIKVSDAELAQVETITRQMQYPAVYRWREDAWVEFPSLKSPDYTPTGDYSGPNFNPTGMRIVAATTGKVEAAVAGILVEKTQRSASDTPWHWISGDTYPHRETLKRWGCRWSKKRKSWYYIGADLPDAVQQLIKQVNVPSDDKVHEQHMSDDDQEPCSIEEASAILGVPIREKSVSQVPDEPEPTPKIRVIKPVLDDRDETIVTAVREAKAESLPVLQSGMTNSHHLQRIPQAACGELTGSITGSVWCYGWAVHEGICVYVNCGGPRMAVEAIRAKLAKGDLVNCVPWDAPSIELTAGEGNSGMYSAFMQNIPEAKFTSLILCHELLTIPNYGGKSTTFIFHVSDEQAMAQLRHHVMKLVKVPVFPEWTGYLWQAGQAAMLVRPTRTGGDVTLWTVTLDIDAWTRLLTGGLAKDVIQLTKAHV